LVSPSLDGETQGINMYKTIVIHVDGSPQQENRLRVAALLASEFDAHLVGSAATGISWLDYGILTGSAGAPTVRVDFDGLRQVCAEHLQRFSERARELGVLSLETRVVDDATDYALLLESRYADLIVLSQDAETPDLSPGARGLPEQVALRGPRPVLVIPETYREQPIPGTVVVGWDGSMPAIRAITAALPLLARADSVKLALINPDELTDLHGEQPGADMALYLARHGAKVDVVLERTRSTAADAMITLAQTSGAGLMVAGAYGHSRFREWVLGGTTRELLKRASVPLLIAH
jgi:nucleotide-binding universal stress UspA family protein